MEQVKILVAEDDVIIAEAILLMIEKMGYSCVGTANVAEKALEIARLKKPDIALLDIRLKGEKTGIWLAEQIKEELDIPYIFMTSFSDKKTVDLAVSTGPYGYLVKPVEYENMFVAIATALGRYSAERKINSSEKQPVAIDDSEQKSSLRIKDLLFVKDEYQYVKINLTDIDYIKSDGNYVEIHCGSHKKVIKETLKNMESKLDNLAFIQVHRSYIVSIRKIEKIGGNYLIVDQSKIPVSKEKKDELLRILNAL